MRFDMDGRPPQVAEYGAAYASIREKLHQPRSIFSPGHRIRMNIVPMFMNVALPWGVFVFCCGITSFWVMYQHPTVVWFLLGLVGAFWLVSIGFAVWARIFDPDPTWFTHLALAVGVAALFGTFCGLGNFDSFSRPYFEVMDLKVARDVDASRTPGSSVVDAGIVHFAAGSRFDTGLSWHFKSSSLYCVAPIISNTSEVPLRQTYDYWAVGKDCCSVSASDFRCGAWGLEGAKSGIRVVSQGDMTMYRLAVQQTESLYDIMAPSPIFLTWSLEPAAEVESWNNQVFKNYLTQVAFAFITCLFSMAMHTCRFSWMARGESVYDVDFYDDPGWLTQGYQKPMDRSTRAFYTA